MKLRYTQPRQNTLRLQIPIKCRVEREKAQKDLKLALPRVLPSTQLQIAPTADFRWSWAETETDRIPDTRAARNLSPPERICRPGRTSWVRALRSSRSRLGPRPLGRGGDRPHRRHTPQGLPRSLRRRIQSRTEGRRATERSVMSSNRVQQAMSVLPVER